VRLCVVFANSNLGQPTAFENWPTLTALFPTHYSGVNENRYSAFIAIDRAEIEQRMTAYFNGRLSLTEVSERMPGVSKLVAGYDPVRVRDAMLANSKLEQSQVVLLGYRPFDNWWMYWKVQTTEPRFA
jgi:hypothetical protein